MATKTEYPISRTCQIWVQINCPTLQNSYATTVCEQKYRSTTGVAIPGFRQRLNRGELLPFTPFEQYEYYFNAPEADNEYKIVNGSCYEWFRNWIPPMAFAGHMTRDSMYSIVEQNRANADLQLQAAAARLYADGWDALTFLAEWKKTVQGFRDLAGRTKDFLERQGPLLTKLRIDKPGLIAVTASRSLLEARYQWRTLFYDAMDLSRMLARLDRVGLRRKKSANDVQVVTDVSSQDMNSTGRWTCKWETTRTTTLSYRGSLIADFRAPDFGFNPITTLWELTPWSFVVDWIVNVGQSLDALSFVLLSRGRYESAIGLNVRQEYTSVIKNLTMTAPWTSTTFKRSASGWAEITWRLPTKVSFIPQISVNLDAYKVADLVALVVTRYKKLLCQVPGMC